MQLGIYYGSSALSGLERWQEAIAQNLSASSVAGYRRTDTAIEGVNVGGPEATQENTDPTQTNNQFAEMLASEMPESSHHIAHRQGTLMTTGNPFNVAIEGDGFFEVETPEGEYLYTRNGEFHVDRSHNLVTSQGYKVNGVGGLIQLLPGGGDIVIDARGNVSQGGTSIGRITLQRFADASGLERVNGGFRATEGRSEDVPDPILRQGYLEASNVSPIHEMVNMIQVSRAYEANTRLISTFDQQAQRAIQALSPS